MIKSHPRTPFLPSAPVVTAAVTAAGAPLAAAVAPLAAAVAPLAAAVAFRAVLLPQTRVPHLRRSHRLRWVFLLLPILLTAASASLQASPRRKPSHPKFTTLKSIPHKSGKSAPSKHPARKHLPPQKHSRQRLAPAAPYEGPENLIADAPAAFQNPHALDPFFRALAAHQSQTSASANAESSVPALADAVRVLQFGDSHTAADLFTGSLRALLQSRFGNGGLGFQFPGHPFAGYHLAGSNRSQTSGWLTEGNKFTQLGDGDLGLGGISISTSRPGESISLTTTCTTLQVQYLRQPEGGRLRFTDNGTFISDLDTSTDPPSESGVHLDPATASSGNPPEPSANPQAFPSAARTAGTLTYACTPGEHTFTLTTLDRAPVRLLGLVTEQPGITYECLGINGAVAPLMLRWNQALFAEYLRQRAPALIVLAYGTNEAAQSPGSNEDYVAQFHRLLQNLHHIVPAAAILVLGPYDRAMRSGRGRRTHWQTFSGTDRIIADQKAACRVDRCAFYDERARMGGPGAMLRWVSAGLAQGDRTHLTGAGYRTLAEALFRDLLAAFTAFQQNSNPSTVSAVIPYTHPARPPLASPSGPA